MDHSYHIVIDARFWRRSTAGLSTYSQQLVRHLVRIDRVNRYTVLISPEDVAEFDVVAPNVHALVVPIKHYSLGEQTKLPRVLDKLRPDLVHFLHFNHPLRYRGRFVVTLHDLTVLYHPVGRQQRNPLRRWAFLATMRHAAKAAERVVAVSESTRGDIVRDLGADPEKVIVIPEGIVPLEQPTTVQRAQLTELGVRPPYLLYLSQWRPHKGIPDLVNAFEQLALKHPKLQLVLAGRPNSAFPEIITAVEHSPLRHRMVTPGFVPDELLPALYTQAVLFVFPSHYEGFGFPPLEAMSLSTPVVAAQASCLPEILGDAAEYFPAGDATALAETIDRLLDDPQRRTKLGKKGKVQAAKYSWSTVAQRTLMLYQDVLG